MNRRTLLPLLSTTAIGLFLVCVVLEMGIAGGGRPAAEAAPNPPIGVGLVVDSAGIDGDLVSWQCHQGLLRSETDFGVNAKVYTPTSETEYEAKLEECADDGMVTCIAASWWLYDATLNAANNHPGTNFAIIDSTYVTYPTNLRGTQFAHDQAGYLAGVLAGLMSESNVVGDIGATFNGEVLSVVEEFVVGYRHGAQCANPDVRVLVDFIEGFQNPTLGAEMAQTLMARGADVIFAPAGVSGNGAVLTATRSGVWGIGVDIDYYDAVYAGGTVPGADKLLSSAVKNFDIAVYETISDTVHGVFTPGTVVYGLDVGGVGLAPFHETDPMVPQSVKDAIETARLGLISSSVDLYEDCREYIYLPAITKPD